MVTSTYNDSPDLRSINFLYIVSCWDAKWKRSTEPLASGKVAEGIPENKQIKFEGPGISVLKMWKGKGLKTQPIYREGIPVSKDLMCVQPSKYREREPFVLYSLSHPYFFFSPFCISTLIATCVWLDLHTQYAKIRSKGKEPWPPECNGWKPGSQTDQDFQSLAFHTELAVTGSFNKCH